MIFLKKVWSFKKVLAYYSQKFARAGHAIRIYFILSFQDLFRLLSDQLKPRKRISMLVQNGGYTIDAAILLIKQVNELMNADILPVCRVVEPLHQCRLGKD